ncbi:MAG TPA: leucyl/phenylalanyl-tRNA--protein transferase [Thermohalobaculum sp.]|nr:leucyl/phenylalanyl-tRNA--protein transferase [Thermohalobaculum sp.]
MKDAESPDLEITPALVLRAYAVGVFPMANSAEDEVIFWVDPRKRGIIPLDGFHLSRSLRRRILRGGYQVRIDHAFVAVIDACAARPETWINQTIRNVFIELHRLGHAHSIEVWIDGNLEGGLYGLRLGGAFFGESMFSKTRDTSKIALAHLVARLRAGGFTLLDTQFTTPHLEGLGAQNVPKAHYHKLLERSIARPANFYSLAVDELPAEVVQLITQRS